MTRKHFNAIAAHFNWQNQQALTPEATKALYDLARELCGTFRTINSNFDTARFMTAAGF